MSRGGQSSGRGQGNTGRLDGNNRWSGSSSTLKSSSANGNHFENQESDSANTDTDVVPTSFASWVIGVLTGGGENKAWFLKYMETAIFKQTCELFKKRTGLDLGWIVAVIVGMISAGTFLPKMATSCLQFFKTQVTSSIILSPNDASLKEGLLKFVRNSAVKPDESWLAFRGRHDERASDGELKPLVGNVKQFFTFDENMFILDKAQTDSAGSSHQDDYDHNQGYDYEDSNAGERLTVRCFGHSNEPIVRLLEHVKKELSMSEKLAVHRVTRGGTCYDLDERDKRPLSSIDMEPKMMERIEREIEDFFHEDSKKLYMATGRPYRMGYLLSGPPGTGKTSLSVAIASHVGVPLAIVNLQNMDDQDLDSQFRNLPIPCVVLIEDIDASSADVGNRSIPTKTKLQHIEEKREKINKGEAVDLINHTLGEWKQHLNTELKRVDVGMKQVEETNRSILHFMEEHVTKDGAQNPTNDWAADDWSGTTKPGSKYQVTAPSQPTPSAKKSVTLSGLLNVIDGAAAMEGRLLIMTTNHPEKLDPALTRTGRCDSTYHIGYATKDSAEQTFKRIFCADPRKLHHSIAIDRMAQAFKEQFPAHSQIPTCDLAKYCGMYRNRPDDAVRDFPKWLRIGDELFSYTIEVSSDAGDIPVNETEIYDPALLYLGPEDFVLPVVSEETSSPCKPVNLGFSVDDVEYDEWPEFSLFTKVFSSARSNNVSSSTVHTAPSAAADDAKFDERPTFDFM